MQGRALLGVVQQITFEQRTNGALQPGFTGQVDQQLAGFAVHQVLRVVEEQATGAQAEGVETLRVGGEGLAHAEAGKALAVGGQGLPAGELGDVQR